MEVNTPGPVESEDRVDDAEVLYRAVWKNDFDRVSETEVTLTENAFGDKSKEPSVDRAHINEYEPERSRFRESDAVVSLIAEKVREITLTQVLPGGQGHPYTFDVVPRPILDKPDPIDNNPAHAQVEADRPLTSSPYKHLKMALARLGKQSVELDPLEQVVYFTRSGKTYHRRSCHHLRKGRQPVRFKKVRPGAVACKQCQPEGWATETDSDG
jgi:hypothetical protein